MRIHFSLEGFQSPAVAGIGPWRWLRWIRRRLALATQVSRERRALARLSAEQLKDIGITAAAAKKEARRGFLDTPYNRRSRLYL